MRLHFDRALVQRLLDHALAAAAHARLRETGTPAPALWLVGDDGVYLMSNGLPALSGELMANGGPLPPLFQGEGSPKNLVCYAREVDPTKLTMETWWAAKRASFGGDDGAELLLATDLVAALATYPSRVQPLMLDVSPDSYGIVVYEPAKDPPKSSAGRPPRKRKPKSAP